MLLGMSCVEHDFQQKFLCHREGCVTKNPPADLAVISSTRGVVCSQGFNGSECCRSYDLQRRHRLAGRSTYLSGSSRTARPALFSTYDSHTFCPAVRPNLALLAATATGDNICTADPTTMALLLAFAIYGTRNSPIFVQVVARIPIMRSMFITISHHRPHPEGRRHHVSIPLLHQLPPS